MKIGIIVHSQTGNTLSVAQRLKGKLLEVGHTVDIEKIVPLDAKQMDVKKVQIETMPNIEQYDALVFGAPVQGASVSAVMKAYLSQLASLKGKKAACYVTEFFPFAWMGGNKSIEQMKKICEAKDTEVCGTGVINWKNAHREEMINGLVEEFSKLF
jgi:menaquinone-dependent protoporphyrinogen IX oxidase